MYRSFNVTPTPILHLCHDEQVDSTSRACTLAPLPPGLLHTYLIYLPFLHHISQRSPLSLIVPTFKASSLTSTLPLFFPSLSLNLLPLLLFCLRPTVTQFTPSNVGQQHQMQSLLTLPQPIQYGNPNLPCRSWQRFSTRWQNPPQLSRLGRRASSTLAVCYYVSHYTMRRSIWVTCIFHY